MDSVVASLGLTQWETALGRVHMALGQAGGDEKRRWAALEVASGVVGAAPDGAPLSPVRRLMLDNCLEHACLAVPGNESQAAMRRHMASRLLDLVNPWQEKPQDMARCAKIALMVIGANDRNILDALVDLPGSPGMERMLRHGWMDVHPEESEPAVAGMRAHNLPAGPDRLPTSIRWLALTASRSGLNDNDGRSGKLSVAQDILLDPRTVSEPLIGDRHVLEFPLAPVVVAGLVGLGVDPGAMASDGRSCLEVAVRSNSASPATVGGLGRLAGPGKSLAGLSMAVRRDIAQAMVDAFIDRWQGQAFGWTGEVARMCQDASTALTDQGERMVDYIARRLSMARHIEEDPTIMVADLGVDLAVAGQGSIDGVPAWVVWEGLVLRYAGNGGWDNPDRGVFCRAAGQEWSRSSVLPLVGTKLMFPGHQATAICRAAEEEPLAAMQAACRFFDYLAGVEHPGLNLEFDVNMMLGALMQHGNLEHAGPEVAGTLAPWLVAFGKPVMGSGAGLDPGCVAKSCDAIEAMLARATSKNSFLGNGRVQGARAHLESMKSSALMGLGTRGNTRTGISPRF